MKTQFTAGPWSINLNTQSKYRYIVTASNGDTICKMLRDDNDDSVTESANVKLIAAAPELLKALKLVHDGMTADRYPESTFTTVEAAISKATD